MMSRIFLIPLVLVLMSARASSQDLRSEANRRGVAVIFDDVHIAEAALGIHQRAAAMPIEERFQYLANWVLPGVDHNTIRVALDYTPTHPVQQNLTQPNVQSRVQAGGDLVSPAIDLVVAAKQLGRLDELHKQLDNTDVQGNEQKRSRLALLAIVNIARDKPMVARENMEQLSELVLTGSHTRFSQRWPETLAIWFTVQSAATQDAVSGMLDHIFLKQVRPGIRSGSEAWRLQMAAIVGSQGNVAFDLVKGERVSFTSDSPLARWQPAMSRTAESSRVVLRHNFRKEVAWKAFFSITVRCWKTGPSNTISIIVPVRFIRTRPSIGLRLCFCQMEFICTESQMERMTAPGSTLRTSSCTPSNVADLTCCL